MPITAVRKPSATATMTKGLQLCAVQHQQQQELQQQLRQYTYSSNKLTATTATTATGTATSAPSSTTDECVSGPGSVWDGGGGAALDLVEGVENVTRCQELCQHRPPCQYVNYYGETLTRATYLNLIIRHISDESRKVCELLEASEAQQKVLLSTSSFAAPWTCVPCPRWGKYLGSELVVDTNTSIVGGVATLDACAELCRQTEACALVHYRTDNFDKVALRRNCYLRKLTSGMEVAFEANSGLLSSPLDDSLCDV